MNSLSDAMPDAPPGTSAMGRPALPAGAKPYYWSLRRELWENRSLYIAPLVVAALVLIGVFMGALRLSERFGAIRVEPAKEAAVTAIPYATAAIAIIVTGFIVGAFYCLGALHNERRDRSILFWKSMPVSDVTAVLTKAAIPLFVLPAVLFAVVVVTQLVMLLFDTLVLAPSGVGVARLWAQWPLVRTSVVLAYGLITLSLWYAPIWGWLLMVSAWAKRAPFLWAVLPPLAVCLVESLALGTGSFARLLGWRLSGAFDTAFSGAIPGSAIVDLQQIDPARFFGSLDLWTGLAAAAAFLAAAVWLRRSRDLS